MQIPDGNFQVSCEQDEVPGTLDKKIIEHKTIVEVY